VANRICGECSLCCKLLPTPEIGSPANERCQHQKHGVGCAIYERRPASCRLWSCAWLIGGPQDMGDLPRPDRAHYVIDPTPDYITLQPHDGSAPQHIPVVQVWVDPLHRDAHRAPSFRRWLDRQKMPAIIRFNERDGFVLAPPSITNGDGWVEQRAGMREKSHTLEQKMAALGGTLERIEPTEAGGVYKAVMTVGGQRIEVAALQADRETALAALADARKMIAERKHDNGEEEE
jgi:hypothetical protein